MGLSGHELPAVVADGSPTARLLALFGRLHTSAAAANDMPGFLADVALMGAQLVGGTASCAVRVDHLDGEPIEAYSDEGARLMVRAERLTRQGPVGEAARTGGTVAVRDLVAEPRWPDYAAQVGDRPPRSSIACALTSGPAVRGVLAVYMSPPGVPAQLVHQVEVFAAQLSAALALLERLLSAERVNLEMEQVLASRSLVDQAVGVLMTTHCLDERAAAARLQHLALEHGLSEPEVASAVIERVTGRPATVRTFRRRTR